MVFTSTKLYQADAENGTVVFNEPL